MSYPYEQYSSENLPTPLESFPQWETVEHEEQSQQPQQQIQAQQQSHQHQAQSLQPEIISPVVTPPQQQPYTIQLEEPPHIVPSQHRSAHDDTPVRLHIVHRPDRRREQQGEIESRHLHIDTTRPSSVSGSGMAIRPTRSQQTHHPYRRPLSASGTPRPREQQVRFASSTSSSIPSPAVPSSAMHSPAIPSPASIQGHLASFSSPVTAQDTRLPPASAIARPPFVIRTDSNYDPETKMLTAMFELPGVKKADLRVTLSTCYYNGVRQITVSGRTTPVFRMPSSSEGDFTIRERKFGEFSRTIPVPSGTKREDIDASVEDGILTLRIPCGAPARADAQEITVR